MRGRLYDVLNSVAKVLNLLESFEAFLIRWLTNLSFCLYCGVLWLQFCTIAPRNYYFTSMLTTRILCPSLDTPLLLLSGFSQSFIGHGFSQSFIGHSFAAFVKTDLKLPIIHLQNFQNFSAF